MRAFVLILDSLGIGAAPDAERFGDLGANTLGHIAEYCVAERAQALHIPHLEQLGLGLACQLGSGELPPGLSPTPNIIGAYGAAAETSTGKDTPSGHWELAGVPVRFDWGSFPQKENSFPPDLLARLAERGNVPGFLGNCHASGTTILEQLGDEHIRTGKPILYTSGDSVFQIACHEQSFGLQRLLDLCAIAREEVDAYHICRVIARPFVGDHPENYERTGNRHDLAVPPPADTVLKKLADNGGQVIAIGKIADIYADVGITRTLKAHGMDALWQTTLDAVRDAPEHSIVMTNFVDFDQNYGHRRDVPGYARALETFDLRLPELYAMMGDDDIAILTADHGCDPTFPGSEHTREHVPVLVFGKRVSPGSLGLRTSFADVGQSLANWFDLSPFPDGAAFIPRRASI